MVTANAPVDIPALKARHPLGDTVEATGVRLRGRGRVRQGVCPFHDEVEGSFTVYADSERFYCFGCGEGGDVLDFIRRVENLSLPEAIARLDGSPGLAPRAANRPAGTRRPTSAALPPRDPALLTAAARFYAGRLRRCLEARAYLASRGVGPVAAARLGLGYSPGSGLRQALESRGFSEKRMRDSGLFMERGAERFAGMVVVPDASGGLVRWLAGRVVDPDRTPRFQALPGPKPVLGLGRLGPAPPWAVMTEGLFDWLALAQWGLHACAALGTQGLDRVAASLRGCPRVFLAFDADDAGREATERLQSLLGRRAASVTLPEGVGDVGELAALPHGRTAFLRLLAQAGRGRPLAAPRRSSAAFPARFFPIPTLIVQEDLCPIHDGLRPRTASRKGSRPSAIRYRNTPRKETRNVQQERKQQRKRERERSPQGDRPRVEHGAGYSRQER